MVRSGTLVRDGQIVKTASSTVSLIELGKHRIVVDSGAFDEREMLREAFEAMGVLVESVEVVVNTHLHRDHVGGNDLFENARLYAHELEDPPIGTTRLSGEITLFPGVVVVPTPGHSKGSMSVFVEGRQRYALCGDALPTKGNYENHVPPFINIDPKLALRSLDEIIAWADVVIPGHDALFEIQRKR